MLTDSTSSPAVIAIIVAAGVGSRMGGDLPKQYLTIAGKTMLEHSVGKLTRDERIRRVIVVLSPTDTIGPSLAFASPKVELARVGGSSRAMSVKNGIAFSGAEKNDWILVHDAARPCVNPADIAKLIDTCVREQRGGILATRINDTIKEASDGQLILRTLPRDGKWAAQTPQMFRCGDLTKAMSQNLDTVTDEASALEQTGYSPLLVEGAPTNLKVTRPEDLWLADLIISAQNKGNGS